MRRALVLAAFLVTCLVSGAAHGAFILLQLDALGGDQWALSVTSSIDAPALGAVNVETLGISAMTLAPGNVGISPPDSVFTPDLFGPGSGYLIINNIGTVPPSTIAPSGSRNVLLATLTATGPFPALTPSETNAFGATFFDIQLGALGRPYGSGTWSARRINAFTIRLAPEPSVLTLLVGALALAGARWLRS